MIAYKKTTLRNLHLLKEAKQWQKDDYISESQYKVIREAHPVNFYHPNFIIRVLLFIASMLALSGLTGILGLALADTMDDAILVLAIFYGLASLVLLDIVFIQGNNHYKSGVTEAVLYHSVLWIIVGLTYVTDYNVFAGLIFSMIVLLMCAVRYGDLLCTAGAIGTFAALVFHSLHNIGDTTQFAIPFVLIAIFTPVYFLLRKYRKDPELDVWNDIILLGESLALIIIYAAGNYFVVRNGMESLMDIYIEEGRDIPFAALFYTLTVIIPIIYLYFGITMKDLVLIRVSLVALAFSVFTFKYYFSLGHPEITLTIAGAVLIAIALALFRYLRVMRNGYTRENLVKEKWAAANPEAFIISQTLGGNQIAGEEAVEAGGGGQSRGGGSTDNW